MPKRKIDKLGEEYIYDKDITIAPPPEPNFSMQVGEDYCCTTFQMQVKKTILNRIKFWLFFQFFPFKLVEWTELKE